jgi:hypothetical protein
MSLIVRLGGEIVVRDSGTGSYTGNAPLRNRLRGAEAHNVVVVDGRPYARIGGLRRLWEIDGDSPPGVSAASGDRQRQTLVAKQRLPAAGGFAEHERRLDWQPGRLLWNDTVYAPRGARVRHYVQLPAGCALAGLVITGPHAVYTLSCPERADVTFDTVESSSAYGSVDPADRLTVEYTCGDQPARVTIEVLRR